MIYRITVDALEPGEEGTESVSFFASTPHDILAAARDLREHLGCTACMAIRFALARCLLAKNPQRRVVLRHSSVIRERTRAVKLNWN